MIKIITSDTLVGINFPLTKENIENYDEILSLIGDEENYPLTINHDNTVYNGKVRKFTDGDEVKFVVSMDRVVILPSGTCIYVNVPSNTTTETTTNCFDNLEKVKLTNSSRLLVLNNKGCPQGYTTITEIKKAVEKSLCDLIGEGGIASGNLVAEDMILTTSGGCSLKAVPQSDIVCE